MNKAEIIKRLTDSINTLQPICDAHIREGVLCTSSSCPLFMDAGDIVSYEFCSSPLCLLNNLKEALNKEKSNESFKQR